jgi:peptidoglycan/xylan/chitin deacetylase (PgdA/CDA1 family)
MSLIARSFRDIKSTWNAGVRLRTAVRDLAVNALAVSRSIDRTTDWIRFPYYHHVFEDERAGFARQLDYLKGFGEFVTLDRAVEMLSSQEPIRGRYFCVTFDDGIKCSYDCAFPVLAERGIPAAFFVVTDYVADDANGAARVAGPLHAASGFDYEYVTWRECAIMARNGMTIGSHTCSHRRLSDIGEEELHLQLQDSRKAIEGRLGAECRHFAAPWGIPGADFQAERDVAAARAAGYRSFLTTRRGRMIAGGSPFAINRDHTLAAWSNAQLRYLFSL